MEGIFLIVALGLYAGLLVAGGIAAATRRRAPAAAMGAVFALAWVAHTAFLIAGGLSRGRVPLANLSEALAAFGWAVGAVALGQAAAHRRWTFTVPCAAMVFLALGGAALLEPEAAPLVPALRSNWLLIHVSAALLAYGAFACAFVADVICLARPRAADPATGRAVSLRAMSWGFAFLTIGIATGAVWANQAWGDFWSWDPKETWSLVTWLLYGTCLHLSFVKGWDGRKASWASVAAFASVLFTFFGVTYLLPSVHGYAK